jgi:hypothetical protein
MSVEAKLDRLEDRINELTGLFLCVFGLEEGHPDDRVRKRIGAMVREHMEWRKQNPIEFIWGDDVDA